MSKEISNNYEGFIFFKYNYYDEKTLLVFALDDQSVISAIRSKKLNGIITYKKQVKLEGQNENASEKEPEVNCIQITDNSKNILDFLESNDTKKIFHEKMKFVRIN